MSASTWRERAATVAKALARRREDDARMYWSRDRLAAHQRERLAELVRYATLHSPFYRRLYGGCVDGDVDLAQLPVVTKTAMMESYDDFVTDPRLTREALSEHVAKIQGDDLWLGEFRVMASSGSSGAKAIYAYDRAAWSGGFTTGGFRMSRLTGLLPGLPRPRMATVAAGDGKHMTFRGGVSIDVGLYRTARFAATLPLSELAEGLGRFSPDFLLGYPSVLALLAQEQCEGRLRIAPKTVVTSSEVCTSAMAAAIRDAWGVTPFDCLGLTETGITAVDCEAHAGLHVFEDLCIIEVVDERGRPVPPLTPGAKALVTNLYNRAQPIIRFEVGDLVTLDDRPCPCGRTLQRIVAFDGRSDDVLDLPGRDGPVALHPLHVRGVLGADPAVLQYQVTWDGVVLAADVVLSERAPADSNDRLRHALVEALGALGAELHVEVRRVDSIRREDGPGKLKLVRRVA